MFLQELCDPPTNQHQMQVSFYFSVNPILMYIFERFKNVIL